MLYINVERIYSGGDTGSHTDQLARIIMPKTGQQLWIAGCILKAVRCCRALGYRTGETRNPVFGEV
jgi:hypothetical protein